MDFSQYEFCTLNMASVKCVLMISAWLFCFGLITSKYGKSYCIASKKTKCSSYLAGESGCGSGLVGFISSRYRQNKGTRLGGEGTETCKPHGHGLPPGVR